MGGIILYRTIPPIDSYCIYNCYYCCGCDKLCPTCKTPSGFAFEGGETCDKEGRNQGKNDNGEDWTCSFCSRTSVGSTRSEPGNTDSEEGCEEVGLVQLGCGIWCSCGSILPPGAVTTTSAHTLKYGDLGWNIIPALSLIHIWRCRRSTLCRSRWSPYH